MSLSFINKKIDIFNPFIFIVALIAYILISIPIFFIKPGLLPNYTINLYIYIGIGTLFFLAGLFIPNIKFIKNKVNNNINKTGTGVETDTKTVTGIFPNFSANIEYFVLFLAILGIILQIINLINLGGIPLFSGVLKANAATKFWLFSYIFFLPPITILLAKYTNNTTNTNINVNDNNEINNKNISGNNSSSNNTDNVKYSDNQQFCSPGSYIVYSSGKAINSFFTNHKSKIYYLLFIFGIGLFALTGYRTTPTVILLSGIIALYYTKNIKNRYFGVLALILFIMLIVVGFISSHAIEWQNWTLNPLELISYRAAYTLRIFDRATNFIGATNGELVYYTITGFFKSVDPRELVGSVVLAKSHSTTSTIFGPPLLDFGSAFLAIVMFIIGFILKLAHMIQKRVNGFMTAFYAIILAHTLVWIETGYTDIVVWLFYVITIILIIYYVFNGKYNCKYSNNNNS
ncbi:MAG: oligosaccharide repeat unit polymerase family protein [Methanobacteriaceae archaeon]